MMWMVWSMFFYTKHNIKTYEVLSPINYHLYVFDLTAFFDYPTKKNQYKIQKNAYPNKTTIHKSSVC
jgi:hypothetical protein